MYTPPDKTNLHFIRACGRELYEVFLTDWLPLYRSLYGGSFKLWAIPCENYGRIRDGLR